MLEALAPVDATMASFATVSTTSTGTASTGVTSATASTTSTGSVPVDLLAVLASPWNDNLMTSLGLVLTDFLGLFSCHQLHVEASVVEEDLFPK